MGGRLGLADTASVTALGDGAAWIWNAVAEELPGAAEVLDIYHALAHIADAGKALFGEGTATARYGRKGAATCSCPMAGRAVRPYRRDAAEAPDLSGHAALGESRASFAANTERLN